MNPGPKKKRRRMKKLRALLDWLLDWILNRAK